ncbi:MAG: SGNH/GDSL hydrolase family protein [Phycisphaerae bacterium]|nr:SGNH/GDSL hydrolase family protein [Phycisphaerae bacterium]
MADRIELRPNETILFIGDSITDAGRREVGVDPLGTGYVYFAGNLLLARYPHLNLKILNKGVSGDTTRSLKWRWDRDCITHMPDVLSLMIGVNDVWYRHDEPDLAVKAVALEEYWDNCRYILEKAQTQCSSRIVLMEPFMFCRDPENAMLADLREYIRAVHLLASEFDAVIVPLQEHIDRRILTIPPDRWAEDMVHPYPWAHAWIAERWLEAAGV